jgi:hypothetical protein
MPNKARFIGLLFVAVPLFAAAAVAQEAISIPQQKLTPMAPPGGPPVGGLRVRTSSPTTAALHWSCVQGAAGYEVLYSMNGSPFTKATAAPINPNCVQDLTQVNPALLAIGSTPTTTYSTGFSHSGLTPGNDYSYVVRALYASGGPADSPPITVRALFPAPAFSGRPTNAGWVTLDWSWSQAGGTFASAYIISRKLAGESSFRPLATMYPPYNVYNDQGVPLGTHEYIVEAVDGEKGTPIAVTTGVLSLWGASIINRVIVSLSWTGVWPGGTVRVHSAPAPTGPFTDITGEGGLSNGSWRGVAPFGSNLHYKVVVTYPNGTRYEALKQLAIPAASDIGLTAVDAWGGARLEWNCDPEVSRYELMRRAGRSGAFLPVGPYAFAVYPKSVLGSKPLCGYDDTTAPLGNDVEYLVLGFKGYRGTEVIRAARAAVYLRAAK